MDDVAFVITLQNDIAFEVCRAEDMEQNYCIMLIKN